MYKDLVELDEYYKYSIYCLFIFKDYSLSNCLQLQVHLQFNIIYYEYLKYS